MELKVLKAAHYKGRQVGEHGIGLYILNRAGYKADTAAFLGDGENEVTALWRWGNLKTRHVTRKRLLEYGFTSVYPDE